MIEHIVSMSESDMPLKKYLRLAYPTLPDWALRDCLKKKEVRVNGQRAGADETVRRGDRLQIYLPEKFFIGDLRVLYEDDGFAAVEKPAGLPVDSDGRGVGADTMLQRARRLWPQARLAHRLDVGTGGVLLVAKNDDAEAALREAFERHEIEKHYRCAVVGTMEHDGGVMRAYLTKDAGAAKVRVTAREQAGSLPIETRYAVLRRLDEVTYLDVQLITGRTHQIRAHLAYVGHPILGDDKYGDRAFNKRHHASQPMLWCRSMALGGRTFISEPPFEELFLGAEKEQPSK